MSKVVKIGYADYMDDDGELTVLCLVDLRVHVYQENPLSWGPPFWSVWHYNDEEGKEREGVQYFKDFETANLRFNDRRPLGMFTVGAECPECRHMEAMYCLRKRELRCMSCDSKWHH